LEGNQKDILFSGKNYSGELEITFSARKLRKKSIFGQICEVRFGKWQKFD
jgi:hypothetical protein